jgi:hypothetical protein
MSPARKAHSPSCAIVRLYRICVLMSMCCTLSYVCIQGRASVRAARAKQVGQPCHASKIEGCASRAGGSVSVACPEMVGVAWRVVVFLRRS